MAKPLPRWVRELWPPGLLVGLGLLAWQVYAERSGVRAIILPAPTQILAAGWETRQVLGAALLTTLLETLVGLGVSLLAGLTIAALLDFSLLARRAIYPLLVASQTLPIMALAPLLIIWFGFGLLPKVLIVTLVCFFPLAISTADGLASADPDWVALLRALGASRWAIWRMVRLPAALPAFFSGLRVAVTYSVVGATIGEWMGGENGLGLYMVRAKNALATDKVFAAILLTAGISLVLVGGLYLIERAALPWYYSAQRRQHWDDTGIF